VGRLWKEWVKRRSLISTLSLLTTFAALDNFTAYLCYYFKPEFFLSYEANRFLVLAFYYGKWEMEFFIVSVLVCLVLSFLLIFRRLRYEILSEFFFLGLACLSLGGTLTNLSGLIFGEILFNPVFLTLIFLGIIIIFTGLKEERKQKS
jgi:hypothetical protein